jgi:hypothetical protein
LYRRAYKLASRDPLRRADLRGLPMDTMKDLLLRWRAANDEHPRVRAMIQRNYEQATAKKKRNLIAMLLRIWHSLGWRT